MNTTILSINTDAASALPCGSAPLSPAVAVVFCADAAYGQYLLVAMQSLLDNISPARQYHLFIFDCGIREQDFSAIQRQCMPYKNVTLKLENIIALLQRHKQEFRAKYYWSAATYGRFFIPELCADYRKVIYADIDMIFNRDIAEAYDIDLGDNYIAAVADPEFVQNRQNKPKINRYMAEILGLSEDNLYVSAGFLVLNIPLWIQDNIAAKCVSFLAAHRPKLLDQDTVNAVCKGRIHYLDAVFNSLIMNQKGSLFYRREAQPSALWQNWKQAYDSEKSIVHYNCYVKPWHDSRSDKAALWWHYARKTEYYEQILQDCITDNSQRRAAGSGVSVRCTVFGIPFLQTKRKADWKKYYLFGLKIAKKHYCPLPPACAEASATTLSKQDFYLLGIRLYSRISREKN